MTRLTPIRERGISHLRWCYVRKLLSLRSGKWRNDGSDGELGAFEGFVEVPGAVLDFFE